MVTGYSTSANGEKNDYDDSGSSSGFIGTPENFSEHVEASRGDGLRHRPSERTVELGNSKLKLVECSCSEAVRKSKESEYGSKDESYNELSTGQYDTNLALAGDYTQRTSDYSGMGKLSSNFGLIPINYSGGGYESSGNYSSGSYAASE